MPKRKRQRFYAVKIPQDPHPTRTIYANWTDCHKAVHGVSGARYKAFTTEAEARAWLGGDDAAVEARPDKRARQAACASTQPYTDIYTDGSCQGNGTAHAAAGCGVWMNYEDPQNLSLRCPGPHQTNNRAEIVAALLGVLSAAPSGPQAPRTTVHTDSQNTMDGASKAQAESNDDVLQVLRAALRAFPHVRLVKVRAHSGVTGNEAADRLADAACRAAAQAQDRIRGL